MSPRSDRRLGGLALGLAAAVAVLPACATTSSMRAGRQAERVDDYDRHRALLKVVIDVDVGSHDHLHV